ncbi:tachykinin receptor-like protein [Saccoglossus kowalevskii]|uniref:Tachykinin receptor-like protein n=1 Tax=Saccoglossus kowalevskii TaxID=10224 RepID=D1LXI8_SACKO|nr:tachykinin receptor-like protein [Saccoglossus kowalevskii]ACY92694.1 tachykinin receptor-like protein [Saccoglossus kowalevskii]
MNNYTYNISCPYPCEDYDYDYDELEMTEEWQTILTLAFSSTIILSILGNVVVIVVLLCVRSNNCLNVYLINLAVADLTMAVFSMPFTFITLMNGHWTFGKEMCSITLFLMQVSVCVSIYTLTAIGIDRYYAVLHPMRRRASKKRNLCIVLIIWIISAMSGSVQIAMARTKQYIWDGEFFYTCGEQWPNKTSAVAYEIFVMCGTYFVPLLAMCYTYIMVGYTLWFRQIPGNADQVRDYKHIKTKRKVVEMLVVVLLMFALCWMPLHVFNIVQRVHRDLKQQDITRQINAALIWIAMSNSFVNPVIYCFMNDSFRNHLKLICRCVCNKTTTNQGEFLVMRHHSHSSPRRETQSTDCKTVRGNTVNENEIYECE